MPLEVGFHPGYERNGIYTVETVLSQLGNSWAVFDGDTIPVISLRYQTFAKSLICVRCGLEGRYFAKERSAKKLKDGSGFKATSKTWHFNLYAVTADGREVIMTKDHILPKSKGGPDTLENLQTMCRPCNCWKQDDRHYQPRLPFRNTIQL
jgi:HNH endonuclease